MNESRVNQSYYQVHQQSYVHQFEKQLSSAALRVPSPNDRAILINNQANNQSSASINSRTNERNLNDRLSNLNNNDSRYVMPELPRGSTRQLLTLHPIVKDAEKRSGQNSFANQTIKNDHLQNSYYHQHGHHSLTFNQQESESEQEESFQSRGGKRKWSPLRSYFKREDYQ